MSAVENRLVSILAMVNDWLKFAEAKNAALLTLDAGAVAGLIGWLGGDSSPPPWLAPSVKAGLALLTVSGLIALASFLPVLDVDWLKLKRKHGRSESVLYFGQITGATPSSYLDALRAAARVEHSDASPTPLERDYAAQIVINAGIATAKFRLFRAAAGTTGSAVGVLAGATLLHILT